jgi:hypothetical protein
MASLRAGQPPGSPASPREAPGPTAQFPGIPNGYQFPLAPDNRRFSPIPEVKQFPPFPPPTALVLRDHFASAAAKPAGPRIVCGMLVAPANADLDPKILVPVPENAPKGVITTIDPQCETRTALPSNSAPRQK